MLLPGLDSLLYHNFGSKKINADLLYICFYRISIQPFISPFLVAIYQLAFILSQKFWNCNCFHAFFVELLRFYNASYIIMLKDV